MAELVSLKLSDPRFEEIFARVKKSYPNACILFIKEIVNPELERRFLERKEMILAQRGQVQERLLFHGTKEQNINLIAAGGFQAGKNKVSAYGMGTYFAKHANYSINYAQPGKDEVSYMFLCRVAIGACAIGYPNQELDTNIIDNTVDSSRNPTIFVTPYDSGALPKFIIGFYRNAK
ncbi:MAG: poly(ADP-ribose) polymerase family protein [Nitrososphaerales archaeon]